MKFLPLVGLFHLDQNIPLAIAIVAASSLLFAGGSTIQHLAVSKAVDKTQDNRKLSILELLTLLKNRLWLVGLLTTVAGATLHAIGLALAPVTVVQPVGILAVPWAVLLAAKLHGFRPGRIIWGSVLLTVVGIVGFTFFSSSTAVKETLIDPLMIATGAVAVFAVGGALGFVGMRSSGFRRCLLLATAGSFYYGMSPTMLKILFELLGKDGYWQAPLFYMALGFLLFGYVVGGWLIQQAYANGPAEIVVGSMTTTDPIVAVGYGIIVLGEGALLTAGDSIGMLITGAMAIGGVILLSKHHPDAQARQLESAEPSDAASPASADRS